jgi:DNA polymerase III epsilon subunit-like protein
MYLFIDTETTGVPRTPRAPPQAVRQWPRLVQIAWAVYDKAGACLSAEAHLVCPSDFAIPAAATRIHGVSTARAKSAGKPLGWVIERFLGAVGEQGRLLVGHNVAFDRSVVAAEMHRLGYSRETVEKGLYATRHLCLMTTAAAFCGLPGRFGMPKYPSLAELHKKLFGEKLEGCHRAPADVEASARCFFRLRELGVIFGGDLMNSCDSGGAKSPGAADGD